jgi:hypothetical protein
MAGMGPGLRREDEIFGSDGVLPRGAARMPSTAQRAGDSMGRRNRGICPMLDIEKLGYFVDRCWSDAIVPTLVEYIKIPNKSPSFDPDWAAHGHMDEAVRLFEGWARERLTALPGATLEIVRLPGRTPLMLIEVPGTFCSTAISTSSRRWSAGPRATVRGFPGSKATGSMAAAAPMTVMRCSAR